MRSHAPGSGAVDARTRFLALAQQASVDGDFELAQELIRQGLDELPDDTLFAFDRTFCLLRGSYVAREEGAAAQAIERAEGALQQLKPTPYRSEMLELRALIDLAESHRSAGDNLKASASLRAGRGAACRARPRPDRDRRDAVQQLGAGPRSILGGRSTRRQSIDGPSISAGRMRRMTQCHRCCSPITPGRCVSWVASMKPRLMPSKATRRPRRRVTKSHQPVVVAAHVDLSPAGCTDARCDDARRSRATASRRSPAGSHRLRVADARAGIARAGTGRSRCSPRLDEPRRSNDQRR